MSEPITSFTGEDYRFLSNFSPCLVEYDGVTYKSVEAAYQAAKTANPLERIIFVFATPSAAKKLGKKLKLRADWDDIKVGIMRDLVKQKFTTHKNLAQRLVATGDAKLIEGNTWNDKFWGVCDGVGSNMLGIILMEVRQEIMERGRYE